MLLACRAVLKGLINHRADSLLLRLLLTRHVGTIHNQGLGMFLAAGRTLNKS